MKQTTLGPLICSLRKQHGMTQAALAKKLGVTDKAVSKWERELSFPDISLFPKLADLLGVTVDDLLSKCSEEGFSSRLLQIMHMSHDVRTPLNVILGCAEMAKKHYEDKKRLLRYLENIRVSGEYLLQVYNNLVMIVSDESGKAITDVSLEEIYELGKCCKMRIPLCAEDDSDSGGTDKDDSNQSFCGENYDFSGKRILVADDLEINFEILLELLKQTGAEVEYAKDGRICLEKVERAPAGFYDLILMDIKMPNMDGIEATRRIRRIKDHRKSTIPIIAITANVYEKERNEALAAGMNDFTAKPVIADQLLALISKDLKDSI